MFYEGFEHPQSWLCFGQSIWAVIATRTDSQHRTALNLLFSCFVFLSGAVGPFVHLCKC